MYQFSREKTFNYHNTNILKKQLCQSAQIGIMLF